MDIFQSLLTTRNGFVSKMVGMILKQMAGLTGGGKMAHPL